MKVIAPTNKSEFLEALLSVDNTVFVDTVSPNFCGIDYKKITESNYNLFIDDCVIKICIIGNTIRQKSFHLKDILGYYILHREDNLPARITYSDFGPTRFEWWVNGEQKRIPQTQELFIEKIRDINHYLHIYPNQENTNFFLYKTFIKIDTESNHSNSYYYSLNDILISLDTILKSLPHLENQPENFDKLQYLLTSDEINIIEMNMI